MLSRGIMPTRIVLNREVKMQPVLLGLVVVALCGLLKIGIARAESKPDITVFKKFFQGCTIVPFQQEMKHPHAWIRGTCLGHSYSNDGLSLATACDLSYTLPAPPQYWTVSNCNFDGRLFELVQLDFKTGQLLQSQRMTNGIGVTKPELIIAEVNEHRQNTGTPPTQPKDTSEPPARKSTSIFGENAAERNPPAQLRDVEPNPSVRQKEADAHEGGRQLRKENTLQEQQPMAAQTASKSNEYFGLALGVATIDEVSKQLIAAGARFKGGLGSNGLPQIDVANYDRFNLFGETVEAWLKFLPKGLLYQIVICYKDHYPKKAVHQMIRDGLDAKYGKSNGLVFQDEAYADYKDGGTEISLIFDYDFIDHETTLTYNWKPVKNEVEKAEAESKENVRQENARKGRNDL
jgi:hypothetical protein